MAHQFKVGDRVRVIHQGCSTYGREGTIDGISGTFCPISVQLDIRDQWNGQWCYEPQCLAPLTPPDTWAADKVREVTKPTFIDVPVKDPAPAWDMPTVAGNRLVTLDHMMAAYKSWLSQQ